MDTNIKSIESENMTEADKILDRFDIETDIKTDIDTDVLIFLDDSEDLTESKNFVQGKNFDKATNNYYLHIIRMKKIFTQLLTQQEKLMLMEYFFYESNLAQIKRFYKRYLKIGDKQSDYRKFFTDAVFKFVINVDIMCYISDKTLITCVEVPPELFGKELKNSIDYELRMFYNRFYHFNTYKHNIKKVCKFKNSDAVYFLRARFMLIAYMNFEYRAKLKLHNSAIKNKEAEPKDNANTQI